MRKVARFLGFIRLKMPSYITARALVGYLLFNPLGWGAVAVAASVFCSTAAIYGYNRLTDREEDRANKRESPPAYGPTAVLLLAAAGFIIAWLGLGGVAPWFWLLLLGFGMFYSRVRVKDIFPLKNIYIALCGAVVFLYGASPQMAFTPGMLVGYVLMALAAFVSCLQADLRDVAGDAAAGVRTIPVVAGKAAGALATYLALAAMAAIVAAMQLAAFYPLAVLAVPAAYHAGRGAHIKAQNYVLLSVMLMPLVLIALQVV